MEVMGKTDLHTRVRACLIGAALIVAGTPAALAQVGGLGGGGVGGRGGIGGPNIPQDAASSAPHDEKPDIAARKAYTAGQKSLDKGKAFAEQAQQASNPDKKARLEEKASDAYYRALDLFTEALSNRGDLVEAWNGAGYVHLHIGAYGEALDDYNHDLQLRPDDRDAEFNRAEACLHLGRLDDVRLAYLDLFNHAREKADQLMRDMQRWIDERRADPQGFRAAELDAFQRWIDEQLRSQAAP
jgi:tetratricopeptide (TPR) repeat protein